MSGGELSEGVLAAHLQPIRGLALAHAIFAAFQVGLIDALADGPKQTTELEHTLGLHPERLSGLLEYLENEGLIEQRGARAALTDRGRELSTVRPWYELLVGGYAGTFAQLPGTLKAGAPYARRDGAHVAIGSCGISDHDALPMVLELMRSGTSPSAVVDLGCGDGTFVSEIAAAFTDVPAFGIEPDEGARKVAEVAAARRGLANLKILAGDALHIPTEAQGLPPGTCYITAFVLQEVLEQSGRAAVVGLLQRTFDADPEATWVVIEVDRRHPLSTEPSDLALGYYNPYFLIHRLTEQRLLPVEDWKAIYDEAGVEVVREVFPNPTYDPLGIKFGHLLRRGARASSR
ncbi:MAG: methyltransferase domain-containing protein [Thermoleophilaceae bacterium]|nr:methyltransferase domain-containing protein [Thermoleophilaceae bacterium]